LIDHSVNKKLGATRNTGRENARGKYIWFVDGDDMNEPIADNVRSIVDGHVVLSRRLATQNHYPPIDILSSLSRVMNEVVNSEHLKSAQRLRSCRLRIRKRKIWSILALMRPAATLKLIDAIEKTRVSGNFTARRYGAS